MFQLQNCLRYQSIRFINLLVCYYNSPQLIYSFTVNTAKVIDYLHREKKNWINCLEKLEQAKPESELLFDRR